jgi:hypothetical protein
LEDRKPIYQYRETDWEFLKRIAGQLGTSMLPGGVSLKPELYFGLPLGYSQKRKESGLREPGLIRLTIHLTGISTIDGSILKY